MMLTAIKHVNFYMVFRLAKEFVSRIWQYYNKRWVYQKKGMDLIQSGTGNGILGHDDKNNILTRCDVEKMSLPKDVQVVEYKRILDR